MTTTRTMGDSTTLDDIPTSGIDIVAWYINGRYAIAEADVQARFPHDRYGWVAIDVLGTRADAADMLDVETGDATPDTANLWVQSWHVLKRPGLAALYVNEGNERAVINACASGGSELGVQYGLVVATLDGLTVSGTGILACQNKGTKLTGGHWDESVVYVNNLWLPITAPAVVTRAEAESAVALVTRYVEQS
jgi:hypothetical protein